MDIKPDVHTVRVLYRLGASESATEQAAIAATRRMNPSYPGEIDGALWGIGRKWCRATNPICSECPLTAVCNKKI
jgi:endonuclease III